MNQVDEFKVIQRHINRARLQRSAALGMLIGSAVASLWHAIRSGGRFLGRKTAEIVKGHVAPSEPTAVPN